MDTNTERILIMRFDLYAQCFVKYQNYTFEINILIRIFFLPPMLMTFHIQLNVHKSNILLCAESQRILRGALEAHYPTDLMCLQLIPLRYHYGGFYVANPCIMLLSILMRILHAYSLPVNIQTKVSHILLKSLNSYVRS